ncbi:MAG TPA: cytochrome c biogenesis protein CcdA [bacterium]|nr:cytochrome c biogenesis protein CcdA [bacterium]
MTRRAIFSILALLGFLGSPHFLAAQQGQPAASGDVVTVKAYPSLRPIPFNDPFKVAVQVIIKEGWHVNAHEGLPQYFIPLEVSLEAGSPFEIAGPIEYPLGVQEALGGVTNPYSVYAGEIRIIVPLRHRHPSKEQVLKIPLELKVQACNDKFCLRPSEISFFPEVQLPFQGESPQPANQEMFTVPQGTGGEQENIIAKYLKNNGIFLTFLLIFLGGLALNLTPCVYPMIPITVSYFGTQKAEKPLVVLGRAAAYVMGISMTYSSLGVTAALTGKILGSTLQSPFVLIGISLLLAGLSLSMFGLYEIQAPTWLLNKVAAGNTQGWIGALGMGLVFGIVAAPCVDPFSIGLLTFVAAKANPYLGFIMFFTLSLGLGFPYLWLGFFSTEIQRLPKSGMWMVWVKKIFGLVLLGMPLYFLNPLLPKDFNHLALPAYLLVCGVLLGWFFSGAGVTPGFKKFQHGFGIFLILVSGLVYQAWPRTVELPFENYDSALLQKSAQDKKPVFIDFTASWCLPCKELEVKTFSDAKVHEALKGWVLLKADLSQYSSGPVEQLKKTYGIMGVPTLVFIGTDGQERKNLRAVGFIPVEEFLEKVASVR